MASVYPLWLLEKMRAQFTSRDASRLTAQKFEQHFSSIHAGAFGTRWSAIASICRRPASLDLGLAFRWPISRARRQMRGDRIKCLGLRTDRTSCINATDSICRCARMESQSGVKRGQWARVDDKSNRSRSACGNATSGTFQHFQIAPSTPSASSTCVPTDDSFAIIISSQFQRKDFEMVNRRSFLSGSALVAAAVVAPAQLSHTS